MYSDVLWESDGYFSEQADTAKELFREYEELAAKYASTISSSKCQGLRSIVLILLMTVMQNYEAKKPSYFATPPTQLINTLHTSLNQILSQPLSDRFAAHKQVSQHIKETVKGLGLEQLAGKPECQANGMTAMYLPNDLRAPDVLPKILNKGVIFAGGLHREIAPKYIRFGHMGVSVTDSGRDDVDKALRALKEGLGEVGYKVPGG